MTTSILRTIKPLVNVEPDDDNFDVDILTAINTAVSILHDVGVGPQEGLIIKDESTEWSELYTEPSLSMIQSFVHIKTRLIFDPPTSATIVKTLEETADQLLWRINEKVEERGGSSL